MQEVFGIPMSTIMFVVVAIFALSLLSVAYIFISNRVMFKMGLRNLPRRGLQTGLVVMGLMLATLIITAAFTTGDTVDYSISNLAYDDLQRSDLGVTFADVDEDKGGDPVYFSDSIADGLESRFANDPDIEGYLPFLFEPVAASNERTGLSEPAVTLAGIDPQRLAALGGLRVAGGGAADLASLGADEVFLTEATADELDAEAGDTINVVVEEQALQLTVAGIVKDEVASGGRDVFNDPNGPGGAVVSLATAQQLTGHEGQINYLTVALKGGVRDSYSHSDTTAARLEPFLQSTEGAALLGVTSHVAEVDTIKQDAVEEAEQFGNLFLTFFMVLGLFSIAAGIMLIFMIFVMMAAERKPEMGMARAVGAQRSNLVQSFVSEGMAYNLIAGAIGAALGVGAAIALVVGALRFGLGDGGSFITGHVTAQSIIISYCLGVVITFVTVVISSVQVSSVNIVAAIRGTPEDETPQPRPKTSWRWVLAGIPALIVPPLGLWLTLRKGFGISWAWILSVAGVLVGGLCILMAKSNGSEFLFSLGFSILPLSVAALASHYRAPARLIWTLVGVCLAAYWLSPVNVSEKLLGREMTGDIEMFVVSGLMVVIAFTLIIVYNASLLTALFHTNGHGRYRVTLLAGAGAVGLASAGAALGDAADGLGQLCYLGAGLLAIVAGFAFAAVRFPRLAPALKMGIAYPLSNRFRTGMTIAMFSLIIFSLTTFSGVNANFAQIFSGDDAKSEWDVIVDANRNSTLPDLAASLGAAGAPVADDIETVGRVSVFTGSQEVREPGADSEWQSYPVIAADQSFLGLTGDKLAARADSYPSDLAALEAVRAQSNLAFIDWPATSDNNDDAYDWQPDVDVEDKRFEAFDVEVRDLTSGRASVVTVIGVLPVKLDWSTVAGVYVNETAYAEVFGAPEYQRAYVKLVDGADAKDAAKGIESALAVEGIQADSIQKLIDDVAAQDAAFTRVFQAFMALGLFVGIAALGVIAFRSVVERRQQIGMLRAIGYQTDTVALTFVLESSFVAVMGILSGVVGGVVVTRNLFTIGLFSGQGSGSFIIPWTEIILFAVVSFVVSLVMTWWPSRSAARVPVADALRYE
ncbi:MAG: FtsX-like permease family protein [Dehalococcoidia bacterium]